MNIFQLTALATAAILVGPQVAHSQIITYNGDYVSNPTVNNSRQFTGSGETRIVTFSDSSALSPASNYTGPAFFGGSSIQNIPTTGTGTFSAFSSTVQDQTPSPDRINLIGSVANSTTGSRTVQNAGMLYFKSGSTFDVTVNNQFSANLTLSFPTSTSSNARWLVRDGSGALYVSNESFAFNSLQNSANLTATTWALLNTGGTDFYQTYGSFGALSLTGLTGAGVYWDGGKTNITSIAAQGTGVRLNTFNVVPEPSTGLLLGAAVGLLIALVRRYRTRVR